MAVKEYERLKALEHSSESPNTRSEKKKST
jgi:hypothetical protein